MDTQTAVAVGIVAVLTGWGAWYALRAWRVWRDLHGDRVVICPETGRPAAVRFDVARAVTSDGGASAIPLDSCSRWAARGPCDQPCAAAARAPETSTATMAREWAGRRFCVSCGGPLLASETSGHHFALREPGGVSREWVDVAAEDLPVRLTTCLPLCWNCHVAETFRRQFPDLVTDRDTAAMRVERP